GKRPDPHAAGAHGPECPRAAARGRDDGARHVAGDLLLRARRAAHPVGARLRARVEGYAPAVAAAVRKGEEVELRVDSLAYGEIGVSRLDGFVVFVRGGLPGDVVRARATKVKRGFAEATRTAL